jgi:hypothetical protein
MHAGRHQAGTKQTQLNSSLPTHLPIVIWPIAELCLARTVHWVLGGVQNNKGSIARWGQDYRKVVAATAVHSSFRPACTPHEAAISSQPLRMKLVCLKREAIAAHGLCRPGIHTPGFSMPLVTYCACTLCAGCACCS